MDADQHFRFSGLHCKKNRLREHQSFFKTLPEENAVSAAQIPGTVSAQKEHLISQMLFSKLLYLILNIQNFFHMF